MPSPQQTFALSIVQRLQAAHHTAYFAGGCVRDQLMSRTPKDYDIATSAKPDQVLALFPRSQKVGAAFGVILVKDKHLQVEVATFRSDGLYSDGRHPDSVHFTTPEQDAKRRDFTCNGLFLDPLTSTLHDFVNGQSDIQQKILRAIGNPHERFAEDHLRMLRAIRFAARLGFTIEPQTSAAITELQNRIQLISRERIGEELRLMLEHPSRTVAVELLASFPILFEEVLGLPPLQSAQSREWPVLAGLPEKSSRPLALAAILLDSQCPDLKPAIHQLRTRLMLSNTELEELLFLAEKLPLLEKWEDLPKHTLKRIMADPRWPTLDALYKADPQNSDQLLAFAERTTTLSDEGVAPPPFITGDTLITLGLSPGPTFKRLLETLYDQQLEGELTTKEDALAATKNLIANKT